jgi:hypothetical protein
VWGAERDRFLGACERSGRTAGALSSLSFAVRQCLGHLQSRSLSLRRPARRGAWIETLGERIHAWWQSVLSVPGGVNGLRATSLMVLPVVGAVLQFLGSERGLVIEGVVLIRPSPRVAAHLPTQRQMGQLDRVSCRKLSVVTRALRSALLLPSGGVRVVPCLEF